MRLYKILCSLLFVLALNSCDKKRYKNTTPVCDKKLYVEEYLLLGGGALGGDKVSEYVTDSSTFRLYVGEYDNADEGFSYKCAGDTLTIFTVTGRRQNNNKIIETRKFSFSELKKADAKTR